MTSGKRTSDEILASLCGAADQAKEEVRFAFFLPATARWRLAAKTRLNPEQDLFLSGLNPQSVSDAILTSGPADEDQSPFRFDTGWARHLVSAGGELLALMICFSENSADPGTEHEAVSQLATLALEQSNLLRDRQALRREEPAPSPHEESSRAIELPMEQITRMIAHQCSPQEILAVLCAHLGSTQRERQAAFFLLEGGEWTLAAKGDLTEQSEAALALVDPDALSNMLFEQDTEVDQCEHSFDEGWARHLYSGNGELMGMIVGLLQEAPTGDRAARTETVCRLALLAMEQHNLIGELTFKAEHDSLTSLFNRGYQERMLRMLLQNNGAEGESITLLNIGLDRFRLVNDVMGLSVGDRLLKQAGRRFQSCLNEGNVLARVGGDEFTVLLTKTKTIAEISLFAERLLRSMHVPFAIDGHELFITASIGISRSSSASTPESLEREASLALYHAKRVGKDRALHFEAFMDATPPERLEMEKRLRSALANCEMVLYYQPQIDINSGRITGAEALIRWRKDGLGLVAPAAFIPILEETGLIGEFGRWALNEACRQGREWMDLLRMPLQIGVNVSAAQLDNPSFVEDVRLALEQNNFPPGLLELELTESLFVGHYGHALAIFRELEKIGVSLALDDFGTGQSSLSYLRDLPFHRLKIDRTFVQGSANSSSCSPLVQEIVRMAQSLGLSTIAEGVENVEDLDALRAMGCEQAQGFLLGRPLAPQDFAALFIRQNAAALTS